MAVYNNSDYYNPPLDFWNCFYWAAVVWIHYVICNCYPRLCHPLVTEISAQKQVRVLGFA